MLKVPWFQHIFLTTCILIFIFVKHLNFTFKFDDLFCLDMVRENCFRYMWSFITANFICWSKLCIFLVLKIKSCIYSATWNKGTRWKDVLNLYKILHIHLSIVTIFFLFIYLCFVTTKCNLLLLNMNIFEYMLYLKSHLILIYMCWYY